MSQFNDGAISCDFSNTLLDDIANSTYLDALGLPANAPLNAKGVSVEPSVRSWQRAYCKIAAHSKNVQGVGAWQPPSNPFDVKITEIRANRDAFFSTLGAGAADLVADWMQALYECLSSEKTPAAAEEKSSSE